MKSGIAPGVEYPKIVPQNGNVIVITSYSIHYTKLYDTTDRKKTGKSDFVFLEKAFQKLLLNFTWWVNRKDADGTDVFEGGFLGLDNIGHFDEMEKYFNSITNIYSTINGRAQPLYKISGESKIDEFITDLEGYQGT